MELIEKKLIIEIDKILYIKKYDVQYIFLNNEAINNHPVWAIEEYVIISFIINWLNPINAPINAEHKDRINKYFDEKDIITKNGAIFCHVKIIIFCIQFKPQTTWGNQKWKGAAPSFIAREQINRASINSKFNELKKKKFIAIEKIIIIDAIAWDRKYLIADSVRLEFNLISIRGIILIKLISNPNQIVNHELDEVANKVPENKKNKKIKL